MATGGNLLQSILDQAHSDVQGAGNAIMQYLGQNKTHPKQTGAISASPQAQQFVSGLPFLSQLQKGGLPAVGQDLMNTLSGKGPAPVIGMGSIETPEEGVTSLNKILGKTKNSPARITLPASVYGAGREAAVQKTVDNIVPGNTAIEKYTNLQPTMSKLGDQITKIMSQNPKVASLDQIMQDYDKNLQNEGVYRTSGIPRDQVQKAARDYMNDLQNEAIQESGGAISPNQISDFGLHSLKQKINQDYQSVAKKIQNGTSLTDRDKVIGAARQTIDDTQTTLHPEVKELTTQQSHLYDAADSLQKAAEKERQQIAGQPTAMQKIANATIKNPYFDILLGATGVHSLGGAVSGLGAVGGVVANDFSNYINKITNPSKGQQQSPGQGPQNNNQGFQINHGPTIANNTTSSNRYILDDPYQKGQLMNTSDYANQAGALSKKIGAEQMTNPIQAHIDQGQLDALNTQYSSQQQLRNAWIGDGKTPGVSQVLTVGNAAFKSVNDADPGFFNALNQGYDKLQTASNGKYAQMSKYLQYLSNVTGTDFTQYKSKEALTSALDSSMNTVKSSWINQLQGFSGQQVSSQGSIPTGPATTAAPAQQAPQGMQAPPANFDFGNQIGR